MIIFFKLKPTRQYTIIYITTFSDKVYTNMLSSSNTQIIGLYSSIDTLLYDSKDDYDFLVVNRSGDEFYITTNYARNMSNLYVFDKKDGVISEVIIR